MGKFDYGRQNFEPLIRADLSEGGNADERVHASPNGRSAGVMRDSAQMPLVRMFHTRNDSRRQSVHWSRGALAAVGE